MKEYATILKEEIEVFARRIKEFEESTDLTVPRSEKLLWELEKGKTEAQLDAWRRGTPTIECEQPFYLVCRAMGLEPYSFPANTDETLRYAELMPILQRMGFPEKCCERTVGQLAMYEIGGLPKPNMILISGQSCDAKRNERRSLATLFNTPGFCLDVPLNEDDKPHLASLNYIADQIEEFIEWAEKRVPGIKYDENKIKEILEIDAIGEKYLREIYQLIKHVPTPITPLDSHRKRFLFFEPSRYYPNMQKAIEFLRICRDELGERVASGKCPEERLRLLWAGQVPQKEVLDIGKVLMKRKVAAPFKFGGVFTRMVGLRCRPIGEVSEYGVKLSPLQEVARKFATNLWSGPGKRWVNCAIDAAHDTGAHGIIHYLTVGCTPMRGMGTPVAERAEKELGIPVLNLEGRLQDPEYMSEEKFEEILSLFIDKCFDWAGKPRQ